MRRLVMALGLAACRDLPAGTQIGIEEGGDCVEVRRERLAHDEIGANGLSPAEVVARAEGTYAATISWGTDPAVPASRAGLALVIAYEGGPAYDVAYEEDRCPPRVEVEVRTTLSTDDGQLDEVWVAPLAGTSDEQGQRLSLDQPAGTFDPSAYADVAGEPVVVWFTVAGGVSDGRIDIVGARDGEDLPVADWGPPGD